MSSNNLKKMEQGGVSKDSSSCLDCPEVVQITQKVFAEVIGTYLLVFAGCCSVVLNKLHGDITFPGICVVWGLTVSVLIYALGHISGAHFNPAVTVAFAIFRHFPVKQVPLYIGAQVAGSLLASGTLYLVFDLDEKLFFGTVPAGSNVQSLVFEILTTFFLMFVASAVATDSRAVGELAGIALGFVIIIDVFIAGPVSGASMNPARTIGPAIVMKIYKGLWVYIVGPFVGALLGAMAYNLVRFTDKPLRDISKSSSFLKSMSKTNR